MQQITQISTEVLRVHPRNQEFFDDIEGKAYEQFKESIKNEGVVTPLIVAPDMTIVSGHQRLKACEDLGIKKVPVIIREDLDDEDEKLKKLLATNFGRTKNDPIKQVKVAAEYVELVGLKNGESKCNKEGKLTRDEIAKELGISVTSLKELIEIDKKLIPQVRELFDKGLIGKSVVNKTFCRISKDEQFELYNMLGDKLCEMTTAQIKNMMRSNKQSRKQIPSITIKNLSIRSNGRCEVCGWGNKYLVGVLHQHHVVEYHKTKDNSIDNLIMICPNCHQIIHTLNNCNDITIKNGILESLEENTYRNINKYIN